MHYSVALLLLLKMRRFTPTFRFITSLLISLVDTQQVLHHSNLQHDNGAEECSFHLRNTVADCSHGNRWEIRLKLPSTIKYLKLNRNKISKISSDGFANLPNLEFLDLSHNRLEILKKDAFKGLIKLKSLLLDGNPLTYIEDNAFKNLPSLTKINIENNSLSCDCHITWLAKWLQRLETSRLSQWQNITCFHPFDKRRMKVVDLDVKAIEAENPRCYFPIRKRRKSGNSRVLNYWTCDGKKVVPLHTYDASLSDLLVCQRLCANAGELFTVIVGTACLCGSITSAAYNTGNGCVLKCKKSKQSSSCSPYTQISFALLHSVSVEPSSSINKLTTIAPVFSSLPISSIAHIGPAASSESSIPHHSDTASALEESLASASISSANSSYSSEKESFISTASRFLLSSIPIGYLSSFSSSETSIPVTPSSWLFVSPMPSISSAADSVVVATPEISSAVNESFDAISSKFIASIALNASTSFTLKSVALPTPSTTNAASNHSSKINIIGNVTMRRNDSSSIYHSFVRLSTNNASQSVLSLQTSTIVVNVTLDKSTKYSNPKTSYVPTTSFTTPYIALTLSAGKTPQVLTSGRRTIRSLYSALSIDRDSSSKMTEASQDAITVTNSTGKIWNFTIIVTVEGSNAEIIQYHIDGNNISVINGRQAIIDGKSIAVPVNKTINTSLSFTRTEEPVAAQHLYEGVSTRLSVYNSDSQVSSAPSRWLSTLNAVVKFSKPSTDNVQINIFSDGDSLAILSINFTSTEVMTLSPDLIKSVNYYVPTFESNVFVFSSPYSYVEAIWTLSDANSILYQNVSKCSRTCVSNTSSLPACQNSSAAVCFLSMTYVVRESGKYSISVNFTNPVTTVVFTQHISFTAETKISQLAINPACDYHSNVNMSKKFFAAFIGDWHVIVWRVSGNLTESNTTTLSHKFMSVGNYDVSIYVHNHFSSATHSIVIEVIEAGAIHGLTIKQPQQESYHATYANISFEAQLCDGENPSLNWSFQNGTNFTTNSTVIYHVFSQPSMYVVSLLAENSKTNVEKASVTIYIQDEIFNFTAFLSERILKVDDPFKIYVYLSQGTDVTYDVTGADLSSTQFKGNISENLRINKAGDFNISITAENKVSKATLFLPVTLQELISLSLPNSAYIPLNRSHLISVNKISGSHMYVKWEFGDGTEYNVTYIGNNAPVTSHAYNNEGTYTLLLYAHNYITPKTTISMLVFVERALDANNRFVVSAHDYVVTNETFNVSITVNYTSIFGYKISSSAFPEPFLLTDQSRIIPLALNATGNHSLDFTASNNVSTIRQTVFITAQDKIVGPISVYPIYVPLSNTNTTRLYATIQESSLVFTWIFPSGIRFNGSFVDYTFSKLGPFPVNVSAENKVSKVTSQVMIYVELMLSNLSLNTNVTFAAINSPVLIESSIPARPEHIYSWAIENVAIDNKRDRLVWIFRGLGTHFVFLNLSNHINAKTSSVSIGVQEPVHDIGIFVQNNLPAIPFNESVKIIARIDSGSDLTYTWKTGSVSKTSNSSSHSVLVEDSGVRYLDVFVEVYNNVSKESATKRIPVVERIDGLQIFTSSIHVVINTSVSFQLRYTAGSNVSINWYVENSVVGNNAELSYAFSHVGIYTVNVTLSNIISSKMSSIVINTHHLIDQLDMSPKIAASSKSTRFAVKGVGGSYVNISWIIPENVVASSASGHNVNLTFPKAGIYLITLKGMNPAHEVIETFRITVEMRITDLSLLHRDVYYTTGTRAFFNATVASGTNATFSWSVMLPYGGKHTEEGDQKTLNYLFTHPGAYAVTIDASNHVSFVSKSVTVFAQNVVHILYLRSPYGNRFLPTNANISFTAMINGTNATVSFTTQGNTTVLGSSESDILLVVHKRGQVIITVSAANSVSAGSKEFPFFAQDVIRGLSIWSSARVIPVGTSIDFQVIAKSGSDMTYQWFNNGTVIPKEAKNYLRQSFLLTGIYDISVTVRNEISETKGNILVYVEPVKCTPALVRIAGGKRRKLLKSQWLYSEASITSNCTLWSVNSQWSLKHASSKSNCLLELDDLKPYELPNAIDLNSPLLAIQPRSFEAGYYCLYYAARYGIGGKFKMYDGILLQVMSSPPIPIIAGGISKTYGQSQSFLLDASQSIDPDSYSTLPTQLLYKWNCSFIGRNQSNSSDHQGCRNTAWSNATKLPIDGGSLVLGFRYSFLLSVKKIGGAPVTSIQRVFIVAKDQPDVLLTCVTCSSYKTRKYVRTRHLKFIGECRRCHEQFGHAVGLFFTWMVTSSNGSVVLNISRSSSELKDLLVIKENTFDGINSYLVILSIKLADNYMTEGEAMLLLKPNEPPANGSCYIEPQYGVTLKTKFFFHCKDWQDLDNLNSPFIYWLRVQGDDSLWTILYRGIQSDVSTYLPVGSATNQRNLRLQILVEDVFGAVSIGLDRNVKVSPPSVTNIGKFLEETVVSGLDLLTRERDLNKVVSISKSSSALISESGIVGSKESDILSNLTQSASNMRASSLESVHQLSTTLQLSAGLVAETSLHTETHEALTRSLANMISKVAEFSLQGQLASPSSLEALLFLTQNNIVAGIVQSQRLSSRIRRAALQQTNSQVKENLNLAMKVYMSVLRTSIPGEDATMISNKYGSVVLKRDKSSLLNKTLVADGCSFILSHTPSNGQDVFQIFNTSYVDPFSVSSVVKSNIAGLSFTTPNGSPILMKDLPVNESVWVKIDGTKSRNTVASNLTKIIPANGKVEGELTIDKEQINNVTFVIEIRINRGNVNELQVFLSPNKVALDDETHFIMNASSNGKLIKHFLPGEFEASEKYFVKMKNKGENEDLNVSVLAYSVSCIFWDRQKEKWSTEGVIVTNETSFNRTVCRSMHLTSFASTFKIEPNPIKWSTLSELNIEKNPIAVAMCLSIIVLYLCSLFFASRKDEEDRREAQYIPEMGSDEYFKYEIRIKTGSFPGAGTSAKVGVQIFSSKCTTKPITLAKAGSFQRNSIELFRFSSPTRLGKIFRIRVWHDNSGTGSSWYLTRIVIKNLLNGQKYFFFCNRWLAVDRDDGEIERVFQVADAKTMARFNTIFNDVVGRTFNDYHLWVSIFEKPRLSRFTRVQRLTCCVTFLLSWMCVDAMWYGTVREGNIDIYLGLKGYSYEEVLVGVISSLMVFPVNFLLVLIFRNCRLPKSRQVLDGDEEVTIHVMPSSQRTRRLSEDWVEIEDFTEGASPLFATSLPRCGGYFRLSVYQPLMTLNEEGKGMFLANFSDPDEEEEKTVDSSHSYSGYSRSIVTYGQKPTNKDHYDQTRYRETGSIGLDDSIASRVLGRSSRLYSKIPVTDDVTSEMDDQRFHVTHERPSSCEVSTVSTLQTRLTASSRKPFGSDTYESIPDERATVRQKLGKESSERDLSVFSEEHISSVSSEPRECRIRTYRNEHRGRKGVEYQDMNDSFSSSRYSSRIASSSTARTPHEFPKNLDEMDTDTMTRIIPDIRELHSNLECLLPSWFVVLAYFGCLGISVLSCIIILIYGQQFGRDKAISWLSSIFAGLFQDIFITYPILLVLVALLIALIRKPMNLDYGDFVTCPVVPGDPSATAEPVRGYALELAQKQGRGKREIRKIVKKLLFQLIHLWIVLSICITGYETNRWLVKRDFESSIATGENGIYNVTSINKLWKWTETDLQNYLFPAIARKENWVLQSTPRIRQIRIRPSDCPAPSVVRYAGMTKPCDLDYSSDNLENRDFMSNWNVTGESKRSPWSFTPEPLMNGTKFLGKLELYPHSGYMTLLGKTKSQFLANAQRLKAAGWLDVQTRAVFIEYVMRNININRYIVTTIAFEFTASGLILPTFEMIYLRVHMYVNRLDYFRLFCEVIFGLLTFYFLWRIQRKLRKNGCQFFAKFWNIHLLFSFMTSAALIGLSIYRLVTFLDLRPLLKNGVPQGYDLRHSAIIDLSIRACMGLVCFLLIFKIISLLTWTRAYRISSLTLRRAGKHLCVLFVGLVLVLTSFASWGYLAFGKNCYYFHSFWTSILYTFLIRNRHIEEAELAVTQSGYFIAWSSLYTFVLLAFVISMFKASMCACYKDARMVYLSGQERHVKEFFKFVYKRFTMKRKKSRKRVKFSLNPSVRRNTLAMSQQTISLGSDQWLSAHSLTSYSHIPSYYKERIMSRLTPSTDEILHYVHQLEHDEILEDEFYSKLEGLASATRNKRLYKLT